MKRTAIFMVAILFCSAIALGCIEEAQEPATKTDETSRKLTHPATEEPHSLLVYCSATVNELVVYTSMKQADASIIREDLIVNSDKMEIVEILREQNIIKIIPIGTLAFSEQGDTARKFVDFVAAPEGKTIFEKHDFTAYPNEKYGD